MQRRRLEAAAKPKVRNYNIQDDAPAGMRSGTAHGPAIGGHGMRRELE